MSEFVLTNATLAPSRQIVAVSNIAVLNVSSYANIASINAYSANIVSMNIVSYENVVSLNVSGFSNINALDVVGNLGVGTAAPSVKCHVESGQLFIGNSTYLSGGTGSSSIASGFNLRFDNTYNGTAGTGSICNKISLYNDTSSQYGFGVENGALVYQSSQSHTWYTGTSGSVYGTNRMTLTNSGLLGIGTTPTATVHVVGNVVASNALTTTNVIASNVLVASGAPASIVQGSNVAVMANASGTGFVVINSLGQVGIGTASPGYAFHTYGGSIGVSGTNNYLYYAVTNSTSSGAYMMFDAATVGGSGRKYQIGSTGTGNNPGTGCFELYDATGGATRFVCNSSGNIGIGKTNPTTNLDIAGALKTSTNSTNYVVGTGVAVTINTTTPTTVGSATITTNGKPVFALCSGDVQPTNGINDWCYIQMYRDSTAIGNIQINHPGTAGSTNKGFCSHVVDVPGAGTYTYSCKAWSGSNGMQFGEVGVPYFSVWEFI